MRSAAGAWVILAMALLLGGCVRGPWFVAPEERATIDRRNVEFPAGSELKVAISGLTGPTTIAWVHEEGEFHGALLIAEGGMEGHRPRIYGFKPDGEYFEIYPRRARIPLQRIPTPLGWFQRHDLHGPIGGMVVTQGRIFVTHRDQEGFGMVSAFDFEGQRTTVVAGLPAQGDHSVTDIAVHPTTGRLYFAVGSATNSGVVGLDNWEAGWVKRHPRFSDAPAVNLRLLGFRFDTRNPMAGIFGGNDIAVTAPFSPFGVSNQTRIPRAANDKPTSAIYSVSPAGGDLRVEAHGIRVPRGLAFNEFANLYFTNNGMELRGTRPVMDDPDAFLKFSPNTWFGYPDFSTDLYSITESRFQPPPEMIQQTGYPELSALLDLSASGLSSPSAFREALLFGVFPALSGAAKFDFVPSSGPFRDFRGNAIIALNGDRAPFATSGRPLKGPVGFKVVRLDLDTKQSRDFIRNTQGGPGSRIDRRGDRLERPIDVKFGPDGRLYILDFGQMEMRNGRMRISPGTGKLFVLEPAQEDAPGPVATDY